MRGGTFHGALGDLPDVEFWGEAKIRAELYRLRGGAFPAAVRTTKLDRFVHGELYSLLDPDRTLQRIDEIEGCNAGLFERDVVDVWQNGDIRKAWTYFYCQAVSNAEQLPDGKFRPGRAGAF